jgi:hypothetical protein
VTGRCRRCSAAVAPVIAPVLTIIASVIAPVMAALDAFADDRRGSDNCRGPRDRCADHSRAPYTSSR